MKWICATCGTEARQPEICSGCGSFMTLLGQPPKEDRYKFAVIVHQDGGHAAYGPFSSVMAADTWADAALDRQNHEVVLMEAPDNAQREA